jgi:rod shape-determining protein MreD
MSVLRSVAAQLLVAASPVLLLELGRGFAELAQVERCAPDWVSIAAAVAALRSEPSAACIWAAGAGLVEDLPSGTPFGLGGARRALLVAILHALRRQWDAGSPLMRPLAAAALAFADKLLLAAALGTWSEGVALGPLAARAALVALATAVAAPVLWPAIDAVRVAASDRAEVS